jgi:hypothetical protein
MPPTETELRAYCRPYGDSIYVKPAGTFMRRPGADDIRHVRGYPLRQSRGEAAKKAFQRCLRDAKVT